LGFLLKNEWSCFFSCLPVLIFGFPVGQEFENFKQGHKKLGRNHQKPGMNYKNPTEIRKNEAGQQKKLQETKIFQQD